jgi:chitinase
MICYFTSWSIYRPGAGRYTPENIDPFLCTHIIYAFAQVSYSGELALFDYSDDNLFTRVVAMKQKNPSLKVLLAVGGWNQGSPAFSRMVNNDVTRRNFVSQSFKFLKKYKFDGLGNLRKQHTHRHEFIF